MALELNFTVDGNQIKGSLIPVKPYILREKISEKVTLIFIKKKIEFISSMRKNEDVLKIQRMKEIGQSVSEIIKLFGSVVAVMLGFSLISGSGGGAALKIMRLFKIIYR